ncbi:hypothetical protein [Dokdonella sp.]|uniref:hypothetical protein n=1 Tax=Dokdonella sp. TaxID=2291710 RepID=UPI00262C1099|nr:hypothetical protein [Dokdonella sp.]
MPPITTVSALAAAFATTVAGAAWEPLWVGSWEYGTMPRGATPVDVRVAADGRLFALLHLTHDGMEHVALARFDEGGAFAWLRERRTTANPPGMELLADGRVAVVDAFGNVARVRVQDGDSGDVVWEDESQAGRISAGVRQLAVGRDGDLLVPVIDGDDLLVARYSADGQRLPDWRWSPGSEDLQVETIVATDDGGAVVGVAGDMLTGGYLLVRFAADGKVVFHDRELGTLGGATFNRRLHVALDEAGDLFVQGALQNPFGAMQAQVWKTAPDGTRRWTRRIAHPDDPRFGSAAVGLVLDGAGDPVVAPQPVLDEGFRLLRLDSATGEVRQESAAAVGGDPRRLVRAPNGRWRVDGTYFIDWQGHIGARIAEFDADLRPCRSLDAGDRHFFSVSTASAAGWTVLAGTLFSGLANDAQVLRYDADGTCERGDAIFPDGFDGAS